MFASKIREKRIFMMPLYIFCVDNFALGPRDVKLSLFYVYKILQSFSSSFIAIYGFRCNALDQVCTKFEVIL